MTRVIATVCTFVAIVAVGLTACSSSDKASDASPTTRESTSTTTVAAPKPLEILVTNDDGYAAPGIDAIAAALMKEPNVHVTVVAPATNQSGTGDKTTAGALVTQSVTTASGIPATSVAGYPADTVNVALDKLGLHPGLVVSGVNFGQNIGPSVNVSGTVGAAKEAVRRGIPALAVSQGIAAQPDYATGVARAIAWFRAHRDSLPGRPTALANLNIPTCATGTAGATLTESVAADVAGRDAGRSNCVAAPPASAHFRDDVDAFINGYATLSDVPAN